jgi:hypothetical protein
LRSKLGYLRSRGHDVMVLRILDPAEVDFTFKLPGMFHDVESGRTLYIDPTTAGKEYRERFTVHAKELKDLCVGLGIDFTQLTIDRPLELALFDLLQARQRRGRRPVRRRPSRRRRASA